ncbi:MAG: hypothetical protein JXA18_04310 [Chitinispirillaceae bacterium]|nr:hypothetical protein [Chitinispirillaceae bacterium]
MGRNDSPRFRSDDRTGRRREEIRNLFLSHRMQPGEAAALKDRDMETATMPFTLFDRQRQCTT